MQHVAVVDYHMGNLRSVSKALEHVGGRDFAVEVTHDPARIRAADRVVFPGQGAARDCMLEIHRLGLAEPLLATVRERPFLGICMGLEVLLEWSEESPDTPCLGLIEGPVRRIPVESAPAGERLSLPQMGWNTVHQTMPHRIWSGIEDQSRFYFANSYHVCPEDETLVAARTPYVIDFVSAIARDNLFAVQFHPEKSQRVGLRLLENFLAWEP